MVLPLVFQRILSLIFDRRKMNLRRYALSIALKLVVLGTVVYACLYSIYNVGTLFILALIYLFGWGIDLETKRDGNSEHQHWWAKYADFYHVMSWIWRNL
jgi:hypothetical protein